MKVELINKNRILLKSIFDSFRKCFIITHAGEKRILETGNRITLGFDKITYLLEVCDIKENHHVCNIFSGPEGIIKVLAFLQPRLITGFDILYEGYTGQNKWIYEIENQFNNFFESINKHFELSLSMSEINFIQGDILDGLELTTKADRIIIDPPFGRISKSLLNIGPEQSMHLLDQAILNSYTHLAEKGFIVTIFPNYWLEHLTIWKTKNFEVMYSTGEENELICLKIVSNGTIH